VFIYGKEGVNTMKKIVGIMVSLACITIAAPVFADPPEGRGYKKHHRHEGRHEYKEEYWDGNCKVERKYKKNGDYKEERKCEAEPYYSRDDSYDYAPPPPVVVYDYPPPPPVVEAEILVRPPVLVLEAPTITVAPPRVTVR
jgi:hypothetical protein